MNRVNKSIGWADYSINPVKGKCPMGCSYCYARRMYDRFKWNPELRLDLKPMLDLALMPEGSRVFIGSTIELFHDSIPDLWQEKIFTLVKRAPWVSCIFLTKCPQNLPREWPENCWVGVTATDYWKYVDACNYLSQVKANVKFLSVEPLLSWDESPQHFFKSSGITWLIIGQQTPVSAKTQPKIEDIREIVEAADKAGVKVFLKDNLRPLLSGYPEFWEDIPQGDHPNYESIAELRQEMP